MCIVAVVGFVILFSFYLSLSFFVDVLVVLVVVQSSLAAAGFRLARLDGSMTNKQRKAELKRFASKGQGGDAGAEVR